MPFGEILGKKSSQTIDISNKISVKDYGKPKNIFSSLLLFFYREKFNDFSEKRFLCKYKLEIAKNVDDLKDKKLREKQEILNTRNRLYYKRANIENESEKDQITKQIIQVTEELKKVKKEIKMCDEVVDNAVKMREQIKQVDEKEQDKVQKKKIRNYEL